MVPTGRWRLARVLDPGAGYASAPSLSVAAPDDPSGSAPLIRAEVVNGSIAALTLLEGAVR